VLAQLDSLPAERLESIRLARDENSRQAQVVSAYPLDERRRSLLAEKLGQVLGASVDCTFSEDAALLAGLRINLGPWVFHANLQDELKSFAECAHDAG
jgi:F-type H+-transporting ATPase subunit b